MPKRYEEKRNFASTPEPGPSQEARGESGALIYCVQKHAARRLHYDLRLEIEGTLVSFAVPKGPSLNPKDKHLAVHVEDHPLGYATFEGSIPKGEYGGGEIIVWDSGVYSPDEDGPLDFENRAAASRRMADGLKKGKLSFTLRGLKLNGSWTLVKTARAENEWLLIKHQDEFASSTRDILAEERSVLSGRTVEDVREGRSGAQALDLSGLEGIKKAAQPRRIDPMKASEAEKPFSKHGWQFEVKLDGIRLIALVEHRKARLMTRNANDVTAKFPSLARELEALPHEGFILDGEVVLYDERGAPSFQGLMERFQLTSPRDLARAEVERPIEYCVFDLLYADGFDLRACTLETRRGALLEGGFQTASTRVLDAFPEIGETLFEQATQHGFEGIVGKKLDSKYHDGVRSSSWIKVKGFHSDEFVVVGYTIGEGMRAKSFGSLVLASRDEEGLVFRAAVGSGFSDLDLEKIRARLDALEDCASPFKERPPVDAKIVWKDPRLIAEVKYGAMTRERRLRFPVFMRLRDDLAQAAPTVHVAASGIEGVVEQLRAARADEAKIVVDGESIRFTNLDRPFWPAFGGAEPVTKRDLAIYYAEVSPWLGPHLHGRPLSLVRTPDGIGGEQFFQKHWDKGLPDFAEEVELWSGTHKRPVRYLMANNLATMIWLAQIAIVEIHPWYSRIDVDADGEGLSLDTSSSDEALDASILDYPDFLVVDLDPNIRSGEEKEGDEPALNQRAFSETVKAAIAFKSILDDLGLTGYLKTSGKTGLHVYVPIRRNIPFDTVRLLAETLGRHLLQIAPEIVTMEWVVKKRPEKIFYDHNQNVRGKTLASIFSPRPVSGAPISFPLRWADLERIYPSDFTVKNGVGKLRAQGDVWQDILSRKQDLRAFLGSG